MASSMFAQKLSQRQLEHYTEADITLYPTSAPALAATVSLATLTPSSRAAASAMPSATAVPVAGLRSVNIKAISLASGTVTADVAAEVSSLIAAPTASAVASVNSQVLSAAVAWISFSSASSASQHSSLASASSYSRWMAGPSGSSARMASSSAASVSSIASASSESARSQVQQRASFLAAVGSGVALPADATTTGVFDPSATVARFVAPTGGADAASANESQGDFFQSLGKTPTSIALTSLTCVAIAAVLIAVVAFVVRRYCVRRRRHRATRYNMFHDEDEAGDAREIVGPSSGNASRYGTDPDRWSARSILRRHSEANDAAYIEGDFRGPTDMRSTAAPVFTDYSLPRPPPPALTADASYPIGTGMARTLSNGSVRSEGYAGVAQAMGIANPSAEDSPRAPSLPYISYQPPISLPLGAAGGVVAAGAVAPRVEGTTSRFSSFSTDAMPADSSSEDPFSTPRQRALDRSGTGRSAWTTDDDDETETVMSDADSFQADRVSLFRRTLSLAGSTKTETSTWRQLEAERKRNDEEVGQALKARRASAAVATAEELMGRAV